MCEPITEWYQSHRVCDDCGIIQEYDGWDMSWHTLNNERQKIVHSKIVIDTQFNRLKIEKCNPYAPPSDEKPIPSKTRITK